MFEGAAHLRHVDKQFLQLRHQLGALVLHLGLHTASALCRQMSRGLNSSLKLGSARHALTRKAGELFDPRSGLGSECPYDRCHILCTSAQKTSAHFDTEVGHESSKCIFLRRHFFQHACRTEN